MSRSYEQFCPVARALELVGERWTLLVARELVLGPRRFTDLMDGLPGISTNVLAARLKELEQAGIVSKRMLPPPAASTVYELTDDPGLGGVLAAMAAWGMTMLGAPRHTEQVRGRWLILAVAVTSTLPGADDATYEFRVDDDVLELRIQDGRIRPRYGPATDPAAVITTDTSTLVETTFGDLKVARAVANKRLTIEGDAAAARNLLESLRAAQHSSGERVVNAR
jgi:DNA-binding HxlR family transcriptional regulator